MPSDLLTCVTLNDTICYALEIGVYNADLADYANHAAKEIGILWNYNQEF